MALSGNKADLVRFLPEKLVSSTPHYKEIIAAGGFEDELEVQSSKVTTDIYSLRARHEEADARMFLHAIKSDSQTVAVHAKDTDVLL